jgi:L-lactate dehydrogenase complex protein LldG
VSSAPLRPGAGTSSAARAAVLAAIRTALADEPARELPPIAPVFPDTPPPSAVELGAAFRKELTALQGETVFVPAAGELPFALARFLTDRGLTTAAVQNSTRVSAALALLKGDRFFQAAGATKERIEAASCGIVEAEALLADTGSVIALFKTRGERLLPYLPRTCIVLADTSQLHAHMDDAALSSLYGAARDGSKGEGVIITGPSRSADIEKVLVLGAHGPGALIVFVVGIADQQS